MCVQMALTETTRLRRVTLYAPCRHLFRAKTAPRSQCFSCTKLIWNLMEATPQFCMAMEVSPSSRALPVSSALQTHDGTKRCKDRCKKSKPAELLP